MIKIEEQDIHINTGFLTTGGGGGEGGASVAKDVSVVTNDFQVITGKNVQSALGEVDTKLALNEDYDSILLSLDPLETDIGAISQVPLQSLQTQMHDGRPSHKASGSIVYDEFGTYGVIDTIEGQTANIATLTKAGGGAGVANAIKDQNKGDAIYDWVGTLAEYNAQNVATTHPEWVCYIIDDISGEGGGTDGASKSLDNVTKEGKQVMSAMGMPSARFDNLSLGANGTTYTAPANGYFHLLKKSTGIQQFCLFSPNKFFNGTPGSDEAVGVFSASGDDKSIAKSLFLPVLKGDRVIVYYNFEGPTIAFRFWYAEGSKE